MLREVGFESFCKFTAGEHHAPATAFAFKSNIRAQADNGPLIRTTWMLFTQAQVIVQLKVWEHVLNERMTGNNSQSSYCPSSWAANYYILNYDKLRKQNSWIR